MPWTDRIKPAAYTAPDGTRILFAFEDVGKVISKKTQAFDFPDTNTTYVQDLGIRGRRYPLTVYFTGDSHDIEAAQFENLLVQRGVGKLEHPLYGARNVVPFGDITRSDNLKTAANQTIFEVTFYESVLAVYPSLLEDTSAAVDVAVESLSFGTFGASVDISKPVAKANFLAMLKALLKGIKKAMGKISGGIAKLENGMAAMDKALNAALDLGVAGPLTMAFQLKALMGAPARSLALLKARLAAYGDLARSIFAGKGAGTGGGTGSSERGGGVVLPGVIVPGVDATETNTFHGNKLVAQLCVAGSALAVTGEKFVSKKAALEAADALTELLAELTEWEDANYDAIADASEGVDPQAPISSGPAAVDTGEDSQQIVQVVAAAVRYLIAQSFTLPPERAMILTGARSPIDLCAELYGTADVLDDFLAANDLAGEEILELPVGRRVVWYA